MLLRSDVNADQSLLQRQLFLSCLVLVHGAESEYQLKIIGWAE